MKVVTKNIGFGIEMADLVCRSMGRICELFVSNEPNDGYLANGSMTGTLGMVEHGVADIAIDNFIILDSSTMRIDFSYPFHIDALTFVTRRAKRVSEIAAIYHPFSFKIWLGVALSTVAMIITSCIVLRKTKSFSEVFKIVIASLLRQPINIQYPTDKLIMFSWILGVMLITNCYISLLLTFLTFPPQNEVRDISKLSKEVHSGRYRIIASNDVRVNMLFSSGERSMQIIAYDIFVHGFSSDGLAEFLQSVQASNVAYLEGKAFLKILKNYYYVADDNIILYFFGLAVRKNFCCKRQLDMAIHRITSAGFYQRIYQESLFVTEYNYMSNMHHAEENFQSLAFTHLSGAFLSLIVGHSIAFLLLVLEVIARYYEQNYRTDFWKTGMV